MRQLLACSVCVHAPAPLQTSFVHESKSDEQLVELERFVQSVVLTLELHDWHSLSGFSVPLL
jgi:hypothetical protein